MSWKKHFNTVDTDKFSGGSRGHKYLGTGVGPARINYSSYLPDVYAGSPNRIDRYQQYEIMDSDPEVNAALDILAEFCTHKLKHNNSPFALRWRHNASNSEVRIVDEYLQIWNKLQKFETRIFRILRNTFKYGDSFFIRDPETFKWHWIDPANVVKIIVNESEGKTPEQYIIKDLSPNFNHLVVTQITQNLIQRHPSGSSASNAGYTPAPAFSQASAHHNYSSSNNSRFGMTEAEYAINAEHVVHISLGEGLDNNFPFGNSLLENIFKVYKQKELLEDAILIYRIQRAPERLVFRVDVGGMPSHMAMSFVERFKNEIQQRRIPSQGGGGCLAMDTLVPLLDNRVLTIKELAVEHRLGKVNWSYSVDPKKNIRAIGLISWAGVTHKKAKVVKLTFENNETLVCTYTHKFPVKDKGKVSAIDLVVNEDLLYKWDLKDKDYIKVISRELLEEEIEVGTLTIDAHESFHNFHTFALKSGVYTYNSNIIDSTYDPLCVDLDTMIPLVDGRVLPLNHIIEEFQNGKQNWVYSCNPETGEPCIAPIDWAGITKENADVVTLYFDNGRTLTCTPDHKIPVYDRGFVAAHDITTDDKLISFKIRTSQLKDQILNQIWDSKKQVWAWSSDYCNGCTVSPGMLPDNIGTTKIIKIEKDTPRDVGTVTVDINETWSKHHTFAIHAGLYIKNSINENFFFPKTCLPLSEKIQVVGKESVTLQQLIDDFNNNVENFVYTVNQETSEIEIGKVGWAGVTRKNAQLIEVSLDNNCVVRCTPDHRFIMRTGEELEAQDLSIGANIMGKHTDTSVCTVQVTGITYLSEYEDTGDITVDPLLYQTDNYGNHNFALDSGVFVHNSDGRGSDVTRLEGGCFSMDTKVSLLDGRELSIEEISKELQKNKTLWTFSAKPGTGELAPGLISWAGVTQPDAAVMKIHFSNGESVVCTPDHRFCVFNKPHVHAYQLKVGDELIALHRNPNTSKVYDSYRETWIDVKEKEKSGIVSSIVNTIENAINFVTFHINHFFRNVDISKPVLTVTKTEYLPERIPVGTLTIDCNELYHDYHTFSLSCGPFVKNSNLGEIDDLRYFTNKLFRGLRIPSSYLPTGSDDSQAQFNDGRVGTAYIQELRFNKYCERLQLLVKDMFDLEFKMFMASRGLNIDSNLFELTFNPPMNFAASRQASIDAERINTFSTIQSIPFISNRFALKRFLGLTEEEVADNERLWAEENQHGHPTFTDAAGEMRSAGMSVSNIDGDLGAAGNLVPPDDVAEDLPPDDLTATQQLPGTPPVM